MSARCSELENIHKVIDLYIDGVRNGNVESLRQAFHAQSSKYLKVTGDSSFGY
ncbi:MAG: nuclear transport factor 2 family protein [Pyrinomonadaceae bacterium]|nr:nuclear transport factor 2 family protein [Pyrinomonadaceae bacterium]